MRSRLGCFLLTLLAVSCAIPEPPPGGPEDKTAPEPVATYPKGGSSGVAADTKIQVEFSEKMNATRFERFFELSPRATIARARWKKNTVTIEFEAPLHPDTTYVVRLKPGYSDIHNVRNTLSFDFAFATSAKIDTGAVAGRVYFRRKPTGKAVVRLFVLPRDSSFAPETARPDREGTTAEDGSYELKYLPGREVPFLVWAFQDENGNSIFEAEQEAGGLASDTLVLSDQQPRREREDIYIVDPREPAVISGRVINATPYDSIPVTVTLHEAADTVPPTYYIRADMEGNYKFDRALRGTYTLHAFIDVKKDSLCGVFPCPGDSTAECPEFCATYPDTLVVEPGDEIGLKNLRLESSQKSAE